VCRDNDLHIYNVTRVINALDESASTLMRFPDGRVMHIQKHVFDAERLPDVDCFKVPQLRVSPVFLSQRFVDAWAAARLRGLDFHQVWSG
jgi:hypothetical protein